MMAIFQIGLRRAGVHLPRASATFAPCLRRQVHPAAPSRVLQQLARTARFARRSYATDTTSGKVASAAAEASSGSSAKSSSFPETNSRIVGYWLVGSAASVFGIVVFGGLTRLTESGYVADGH